MEGRSNVGFFLSASGFTKDATDRLKSMASDRSVPPIAPITGRDIAELLQQHTDLSRFFKTAIRKVA